jgi:hypothetical protein
VQDIKRTAARRQQWLAAGHGEYREAATEKDFFAEVKGEERVVCHFYRDSWPCKVGPAPPGWFVPWTLMQIRQGSSPVART